ncbi:MAG: class I adenylate-forming enzyme family protein [Acetobacteraceae bacterium]
MAGAILSLQDARRTRQFHAAGYWRDETMYDLLRERARNAPDRFFIRDGAGRLTNGEALAWVDTVAVDLSGAGLHPGDRVSIWLPSSIESALILLACSRMGYVCNPSLHLGYTTGEAVDILRRARSAALFTERGYARDDGEVDVEATLSALPHLRKLYFLKESEPSGGGSRFGLERREGAAPPPSGSPDAVMYLAFTSGTTGFPKGVMHSDNTLLANGRAIALDWRLGEGDVVCSLSPMSHNMGTDALAIVLACGGELVVGVTAGAEETLDRVLRTGATYLIGVPTHAIDLIAVAKGRGLGRLGCVRAFQLSGAAVPGTVVERLLELGVTPQNTFGMTENCSFQYTRPGDSRETMINTCGRPCAGFEVKIWTEENRDVEAKNGDAGEIGARGACLMLGYFGDQAATEESFNGEGWFMTGDLGRIDRDGNLRIVGRKKDLIIRGGNNINPAPIEDFALRHPEVLKAAAFPVPDARLGERVCLAVVLREKGAVTAEALLEHLGFLGLSRYSMPEYIAEMETLPMTATGKVLKRKLSGMVCEGVLTPTSVRWSGRSNGRKEA